MSNELFSEDPDDPALDALLAKARWTDPSDDALRRLHHQWKMLSRESGLSSIHAGARSRVATELLAAAQRAVTLPRGRVLAHTPLAFVRPLLAAAAVVALMFAGQAAWKHWRTRPGQIVARPSVHKQETVARVESGPPQPGPSAPGFAIVPIVSREPTALEKMLCEPRPIARRVSPSVAAVHNAKPTSDDLKTPDESDVNMDAVNALCRAADAGVLAKIARTEPNASSRQRLLTALLHRPPQQAVPLYLELLSDPRTATDATHALRDVPAAFVNAIFERLDDRRVDVRLAAARALGHIDGPATTARLATMVRDGQDRREALIALACSDGPDARAFLYKGAVSTSLGGAVRSILIQQHDLH